MQLDRVPPRFPTIPDPTPGLEPLHDAAAPTELPGTEHGGPGVVPLEAPTWEAVAAATSPRPLRHWKEWTLLVLICCTLLGQGERYRVDPRFSTPVATLTTYWEALRADDGDRVMECFWSPGEASPHPGALWFLPPSDALNISSIRYSAGHGEAVIATYEVRFRPRGTDTEGRVVISTELFRVRGEWRITKAWGESGMPEWRPVTRRVDI